MNIYLQIGDRHTMELEASSFTAAMPEASQLYREYRDATGEGFRTFPIGHILFGNEPLAEVSYNGKVWPLGGTAFPRDPSLQPLFDPAMKISALPSR
ncbi:MAG: hypothetical protein CMB99_16585 [Flavobacteriaceae bacterium]|jgi:hypothetical protein|nr:hypothetical protein [Flavobacteriaceae bacterium]|tara:strand:+ start:1068 stop:1358 length:291 start_codon:yes stop_codon:yes gene_type:complete